MSRLAKLLASRPLCRGLFMMLILLPLLSSCAVRDMLEDLPQVDSFGSFISAVLLVGVINLVYNLIVGFFFRHSFVTELVFFILLISFSPYGFFMSLLITIVGRAIGFVLSLLLAFIWSLFTGGLGNSQS